MSGASYSDEPLYSLGIALHPRAAQLRMRRALYGHYRVPDGSAAPASPPDGAVSFALRMQPTPGAADDLWKLLGTG
jgi:hypothetical protein